MFDASLSVEECTRLFSYILFDNAVQLSDFNSCFSENRTERKGEREREMNIFIYFYSESYFLYNY